MTQPANQPEIAAAYNDWADTYDTDLNHTRDLAGKILRQVELEFAGRKVIEIGCGTGLNTEWLLEQATGGAGAAEIVALDFSEEMLLRARARVADPRARFLQHDIRTTWPLADASTDVVIGMLVLEHVEHLEPVFAEAARTLVPGGELFICELHPMRQAMGKQAQFTSAKTGAHTRVPAFLHNVSDYVNAASSSRFALVDKGEWRDEGAHGENPPRLLSLNFRLTVVD